MFLINAGKALTPFTPAALPGLIGWWKADTGVFSDAGITPATNGGAVQQWNDQSGAGFNLLQVNAPNQGTYNANTLNGLPTLNFLSTHGMATSTSFALGGTTASAFLVARYTDSNFNGRLLAFSVGGGDTGPTSAIFVLEQSLTAVETYNNGDKSGGTVVSGSWNELGTIFDGVNDTFYVNNSAGTPVGATPTFAATGAIEINQNAGGGQTTDYAEIVLTNTPLSSTNRGLLHTYFQSRWGV